MIKHFNRVVITHIFKLVVASLLFFLAACTSKPPTAAPVEPGALTTSPSPTATIKQSPTAAEITETSLVPTETTAPPTPPEPAALKPGYTILAALDYRTHTLTANALVTYPNMTGKDLDELVFIVEPNRYPGAFLLNAIELPDGTVVSNYTLEYTTLRVPLSEPLIPDDAIDVSITYQINLPPLAEPNDIFGPNPFGYTHRQLNLVDWYPMVPAHSPDDGWLIHNPWYYGEHMVYPLADIEVSLQVTNAPDDTVVAASTTGSVQDDWYSYKIEDARNFVFSISPAYKVQEAEVGGTRILGYYFPEDEAAAKAGFQATLDAFTLYSELFHAYPQPSLTMIEADFNHGMEYQGLYFLSNGFYNLYDGTQENYLVSIAVHETAHQWWYGLVANDQAMEPWLDEALCTYSERLFYENVYPESENWWWYARINFYQPDGAVNTAIYDTTGYRPYVNAVYLRGALFMEDLRMLVGDDAFFAFLKDYTSKNRDEIMTGERFFAILEKHSNTDISPLLEEYFKP